MPSSSEHPVWIILPEFKRICLRLNGSFTMHPTPEFLSVWSTKAASSQNKSSGERRETILYNALIIQEQTASTVYGLDLGGNALPSLLGYLEFSWPPNLNCMHIARVILGDFPPNVRLPVA